MNFSRNQSCKRCGTENESFVPSRNNAFRSPRDSPPSRGSSSRYGTSSRGNDYKNNEFNSRESDRFDDFGPPKTPGFRAQSNSWGEIEGERGGNEGGGLGFRKNKFEVWTPDFDDEEGEKLKKTVQLGNDDFSGEREEGYSGGENRGFREGSGKRDLGATQRGEGFRNWKDEGRTWGRERSGGERGGQFSEGKNWGERGRNEGDIRGGRRRSEGRTGGKGRDFWEEYAEGPSEVDKEQKYNY